MYGGVLITQEVAHEVQQGSHLPLNLPRWVSIVPHMDGPATTPTLGRGELSTIHAALSIPADIVLLDDLAARKYAQKLNLTVTGCVGILESAFRRGFIPSLESAFGDLLAAGAYVDRALLETILFNVRIHPGHSSRPE